MSDFIDVTEGQASFVSAREDAWHRLGTTLEGTFTAEEAMKVAHLGEWDVRKTPAFTVDAKTGLSIPMPGRYGVIRDNPITKGQVDFLGNVGETYRVIQNEQHADLLNALVDESGAHFETAGAINGGSRVFITMKMPGHLMVGGVDRVDNYIAAMNTHDGSSAFTFMITPIRIVCSNTLNLAMSQATNVFRVRHTQGAEKVMVNQAREALDLTFKYLDKFQEQAETLINTTMTQSQFEQIIAAEFGVAEDSPAATITRSENKIEEMSWLFAEAGTQDGVRDTAWAGFNALTEWADHYSAVRNDDVVTARATKSIMDTTFKQRALAVMMASV